MALHDDPEWLDRMYNNRARVPEHASYFARWAADSVAARRSQSGAAVDVRYGAGPNETLDVFPATETEASATASSAANAGPAPVLLFIHGGYWRSLDKSDHSFIAPPFTRRGVCVVVPNYALCPGTDAQPVTIPDIALQMARALAWCVQNVAAHGGDPGRITVAGHSAGGHLAAMLLGLPQWAARNALSISGLYDLHPLMHTPSLQSALRLTPADALRASPALWPAPKHSTLYSVVGGNESEEFLRHNALIREAWGKRTVPVCEVLPGLDHFSIVDALADPAHALHRHAMQLLQG